MLTQQILRFVWLSDRIDKSFLSRQCVDSKTKGSLCSRPLEKKSKWSVQLSANSCTEIFPESEEKLAYVMNNLHNDHLFCYGIEKPVSCE